MSVPKGWTTFLLYVCCDLFECYSVYFPFYVLRHQNEPTTQLPSNPAAHRPPASTVAPIAPISQRDTLEYRTALELERWKEEQEDLFDNEVKLDKWMVVDSSPHL